MRIGEIQRTIEIEPAEEPVPVAVPAPAQPAPAPAQPAPEQVPEPVRP